jgi:hypothetical protein
MHLDWSQMVGKHLYRMGKIQARLVFPRRHRADPALADNKLVTRSPVLVRQPVPGGSRETKLPSTLVEQWISRTGLRIEGMTKRQRPLFPD